MLSGVRRQGLEGNLGSQHPPRTRRSWFPALRVARPLEMHEPAVGALRSTGPETHSGRKWKRAKSGRVWTDTGAAPRFAGLIGPAFEVRLVLSTQWTNGRRRFDSSPDCISGYASPAAPGFPSCIGLARTKSLPMLSIEFSAMHVCRTSCPDTP